MRLKGKVAIITGTANEVGAEEAKLLEVKAEIKAAGGGITAIKKTLFLKTNGMPLWTST